MPVSVFTPNLVGYQSQGMASFGNGLALAVSKFAGDTLETWKNVKGAEQSAAQIAGMMDMPEMADTFSSFAKSSVLAGADPLKVQSMMMEVGLTQYKQKQDLAMQKARDEFAVQRDLTNFDQSIQKMTYGDQLATQRENAGIPGYNLGSGVAPDMGGASNAQDFMDVGNLGELLPTATTDIAPTPMGENVPDIGIPMGLDGAPVPGVSGVPAVTGEAPKRVFPTSHPFVDNGDGTRSNVKLASFEADGRGYVIPTMVDGSQLTFEQALDVAKKNGLRNYPSFATGAEADAWAKENHGRINADGTMITGEAPSTINPALFGPTEQPAQSGPITTPSMVPETVNSSSFGGGPVTVDPAMGNATREELAAAFGARLPAAAAAPARQASGDLEIFDRYPKNTSGVQAAIAAIGLKNGKEGVAMSPEISDRIQQLNKNSPKQVENAMKIYEDAYKKGMIQDNRADIEAGRQARQKIAEERVAIYREKIAQGNADASGADPKKLNSTAASMRKSIPETTVKMGGAMAMFDQFRPDATTRQMIAAKLAMGDGPGAVRTLKENARFAIPDDVLTKLENNAPQAAAAFSGGVADLVHFATFVQEAANNGNLAKIDPVERKSMAAFAKAQANAFGLVPIEAFAMQNASGQPVRPNPEHLAAMLLNPEDNAQQQAAGQPATQAATTQREFKPEDLYKQISEVSPDVGSVNPGTQPGPYWVEKKVKAKGGLNLNDPDSGYVVNASNLSKFIGGKDAPFRLIGVNAAEDNNADTDMTMKQKGKFGFDNIDEGTRFGTAADTAIRAWAQDKKFHVYTPKGEPKSVDGRRALVDVYFEGPNGELRSLADHLVKMGWAYPTPRGDVGSPFDLPGQNSAPAIAKKHNEMFKGLPGAQVAAQAAPAGASNAATGAKPLLPSTRAVPPPPR